MTLGLEPATGAEPPESGSTSDRRAPRTSRVVESLSVPPADAARHPFDDVGQLRQLRQLVARRARRAGLSDARVDDLTLAVSELATNSIQHGGGKGLLVIWEVANDVGNEVIVQVSDAGEFRKGTPSRTSPDPTAPGGRGLWMVDAVCDLVERHSSVHGHITRVHFWGPDRRAVHDQQ